ncbi:MAG: RDD family protein [bacterium]|nr:RDD family protein [bacterium]MCY3953985.1 RDD family protein [bacterium]MCY4102440.1 RDD family protein [bacterium]
MAYGDEQPPRHDGPWAGARRAFGRRGASPGWVTLDTGEQLELAEPSARLSAKVIDLLILVAVIVGGVVLVLVTLVAEGLGVGIGLVEGVFLSALLIVLASLLYDPLLIAIRGQTIGKKATGIRVVRADNGELPTLGASFARWALPGVLLAIPGAGYVLVALCFSSLTRDASRRGWHDKVAGTIVVVA